MRALALLLAAPTVALAGLWPSAQPELLPVEAAFQLEPVTWQAGTLRVPLRVAPGHYLYRDKLSVAPLADAELSLPAGEAYHDEHFGDVVIYRHDIAAEAPMATPPHTVTVRWQGCADAGICYPPQIRTVPVEVLP
ncbi:hypothetical protein JN531_010970 [Flagellatimonas centrodinii]|uniref:protein-disulfide reductase DsbD domain-containing protein n=1 Tax=Flagellatimonas centrodinii TaxID=2806210 RepID=UPI001FEFE33A|nr:protein-disulfide reductase DsbD domain-containing protein [Flagellatimonas centrodinii]ULQ45636.1 hypothetical protein JN531_010970 [Flagellatimonas centrodinii]